MNKLISHMEIKRGVMKEQQDKDNKGLIAAVVVLVITVGVLLWLLFKPMSKPDKIETGNVDVFDIRIGCICEGEDCAKDKDGFIPDLTPSKRERGEYREGKINGETDTDIDDDGIVYVDDKNGSYVYQKNLAIFENAAFEYTDKIAPGVSNSYRFKVHNETSGSIRYNIVFSEKSEYDINMLYRLKRGDDYVVGSDSQWVRAAELVSAMKDLSSDGVDNYTLDWQWPYESGRDALDTEIGEKMTSKYSLGIKINFEEI